MEEDEVTLIEYHFSVIQRTRRHSLRFLANRVLHNTESTKNSNDYREHIDRVLESLR